MLGRHLLVHTSYLVVTYGVLYVSWEGIFLNIFTLLCSLALRTLPADDAGHIVIPPYPECAVE